MSAPLTRRRLVQGGAVVLGAAVAGFPASARAPVGLPATFDPEAFVSDLLAAGCRVAVHWPVGWASEPAYWHVYPADVTGTPTAGEREVRARWAVAMAACPDANERVLAVCRRRVEEARKVVDEVTS